LPAPKPSPMNWKSSTSSSERGETSESRASHGPRSPFASGQAGRGRGSISPSRTAASSRSRSGLSPTRRRRNRRPAADRRLHREPHFISTNPAPSVDATAGTVRSKKRSHRLQPPSLSEKKVSSRRCDLNQSATNVPINWKRESIVSDDALILPHRANPARMEFSGATGSDSHFTLTSTFMPNSSPEFPT